MSYMAPTLAEIMEVAESRGWLSGDESPPHGGTCWRHHRRCAFRAAVEIAARQPAPEPPGPANLLGAGADLFDGSEDMAALASPAATAQRARRLLAEAENGMTEMWYARLRDFLSEIAESKP